MLNLEKNVDLKPFNTFGIRANAKYFSRIHNADQMKELVRSEIFKDERHVVLGGGSNVLFIRDFDGLVIHNETKGIEKVNENDDTISLRASSGELWHSLVLHCVAENWGGIENLSLIPGTVGAAPIQNIGAYGVEVRDVIENVDVIDLGDGSSKTFTNDECRFEYRESVFKRELKEKIFISSVTLRLSKKNHRLNTQYGAINDTLRAMQVSEPTLRSVSDAVIKIRTEKLPDVRAVGNAGSFFKNPDISAEAFEKLKHTFPGIPHYPAANQRVKVPAGWLIEQCGWKGKKINHVGVHAMQALVLVNFGDAKGEEIFQLATEIITSVREKFSITLTPEVNIF